jgi:outer membrane protein OmpA-like peptidoglycan-associated protein
MNSKIATCLALALVMTGCASTPKDNPELDLARSAVQSAEADPNVAKYAALDLESAKQELAVAESAYMHRDQPAVSQPAYLATQTAKLAQLKASAKADDARVAAGQAERDQIQLAARSREVNNAKVATAQANMATDQAKAKADRLQAEVDALKAKPSDRGLVLTLGDLLFDTGKAELNSGASRKLDQLAQFLTEHPDRRVQIDGFTDSVGTDSFNLELSQRRSDSVRSALQTRGIDASRIGTQGYGKAYPVATNADAGGRQLNRRVEVVIGGDDGAPVAARR